MGGERIHRLNRVLFVSRQFPSDIAKSVHGIYLRMRLFLDALAELAEKIGVLFYVEPGVDTSPAATRRGGEDLFSAWGLRVSVTLCSVDEPSGKGVSAWDRYVKPAVSLFAQSPYVGTAWAR